VILDRVKEAILSFLFVCGAQGCCDSLSTTQPFEQHDWMQLKHKSPELMRESRAGIATVKT
jgi:hypothetical protein